jgi:hypothetical protein
VTIAQYITSAILLFFTLYYAPALWRSDQQLTATHIGVWTLSVLACAVAAVGVAP